MTLLDNRKIYSNLLVPTVIRSALFIGNLFYIQFLIDIKPAVMACVKLEFNKFLNNIHVRNRQMMSIISWAPYSRVSIQTQIESND